MSFRNAIAKRALENVQTYMKRFDIHETVTYVTSAFSYHGEIPFLYREFRPTDKLEPSRKREPGGFKVVCSYAFTHQPTDPPWTFSASSYPRDNVDILSAHQVRRRNCLPDWDPPHWSACARLCSSTYTPTHSCQSQLVINAC